MEYKVISLEQYAGVVGQIEDMINAFAIDGWHPVLMIHDSLLFRRNVGSYLNND